MTIKMKSFAALGLGLAAAVVSAGSALAAVATDDINVRSGPGAGYRVISELAAGDYVDIVRSAGSWCLIAGPGPNGWVICAALAEDNYNYYPNYYDYPDYGFYGPEFGGGFGFGFRGHFPPPHGHFPPPHGGGGGGGMPPPHFGGGGGMPPPHFGGGGGMPPPHFGGGGGGGGGGGQEWWMPHGGR
jgi:hypothetical protein